MEILLKIEKTDKILIRCKNESSLKKHEVCSTFIKRILRLFIFMMDCKSEVMKSRKLSFQLPLIVKFAYQCKKVWRLNGYHLLKIEKLPRISVRT